MNRKVRVRFRVASLVAAALVVAGVALARHSDAADPPPPRENGLRFDGVYQSEQQSDEGIHYHSYFRFYEDGTVITVSSTGTPAEVWKWLDRNSDAISRGTYKVTGMQIVFTIESKKGKVDHDGSLNGEKIDLRIRSHINEARHQMTCSFVNPSE